MAERSSRLRFERVKTLGKNRGHAIIAFLVLTFAIVIVLGLIQYGGQSSANNGNLTGTKSVTSMISSVWGWNGTTWKSATMTVTPASYKVAAAFPGGFAPQEVLFITANSSFSNTHLLEDSLIFTTATVTITTTGGAKALLNSAYAYIGTFHNSSSTNKQADKFITNFAVNSTLYQGSTNNLGQPVEYNVLDMFATPMYALPQYQVNLGGVAANGTLSTVTVTLTAYLSSPFGYNIISVVSFTILAIAAVNLFFVWNAIPTHTRD